MFRILCICLFVTSPVLAQDSALEQLHAFTGDLQSLQARFEQQITDVDGRVVEVSSGSLAMQKPDSFRWDYTGEYPQQIIADGKNVWIYDIELEQVSIKSQSTAAANSPLSVLTHPETLEEQFTVTEIGEADGEWLLQLEPVNEQAEFERIIIGFTDNQMRSMILEDTFGQRTRIDYHDLEANGEIAAATFEFTVPEDVDVIGELQAE